MTIDRPRLFAYATAMLVVVLFAAANAHLVMVSLSSQPECTLTQQGGAAAYRAAKPSC